MKRVKTVNSLISLNAVFFVTSPLPIMQQGLTEVKLSSPTSTLSSSQLFTKHNGNIYMWKADTLQPKNLMQVMINLKHGNVLRKKKTEVFYLLQEQTA